MLKRKHKIIFDHTMTLLLVHLQLSFSMHRFMEQFEYKYIYMYILELLTSLVAKSTTIQCLFAF